MTVPGAHDPTRLGLELYTRDILNDEVGGLPNVPGSQVRRIAQRVVDMVLREFTPSHVGLHKVIPVPVCPDCHAPMHKAFEDYRGETRVHWTCQCEGEQTTHPPSPVIRLKCSRCGTTAPRPDHCHPVPCPTCGYRMSLLLKRPGMGDVGMMVRVSVPEDEN